MKHPVLLIGGTYDGETLDVDDSENIVQIPKYIEDCNLVSENESNTIDEMELEIYKRESLSTKNKKFYFFRHEGLTLEKMIEMLILHYKN